MATLYGSQYQDAYVDVPSEKIKPGDLSGDVKIMYFNYTFTAVPTNGDIIKLGKLPKGARVIEACLSFPDLGTAGVLDLGWAASADGTSEAADADGFLVDVDVNAAADTVLMSSGLNVPGMLKEFAAEVDVQIDVNTAWTVASGTLKGYIAYVIV